MRTPKSLWYLSRWVVLAATLLTVCQGYDPDSESINEDHHSNRPRFLKFYSRPHPDAEKQVGVGLKQHFRNVLNGGTFGIHTEFRPFGQIQGLINHAKKMVPEPDLPGIFDGKGKIFPDKEIPGILDDDEPLWKPEKGEEPVEEKPDRADMESEEPDWEHQDSKKPKADGPKWGDIGEEGDDQVPVEEVIQPRRRPKRFVDSHVYHVPLDFVSNAKPFGIKVRQPNEI